MHQFSHKVVVTGIPAKVVAAQKFCFYCYYVENPDEENDLEGRGLTPTEFATYEAALGVLLNYFHGEMDHLPPVITVQEEPPPIAVPHGFTLAPLQANGQT